MLTDPICKMFSSKKILSYFDLYTICIRTVITVLILLSVVSLNVNGQGKAFDNIGVNEGLTSNYINVIIQDSKGFIWLGTNNGLNRYDGFKPKEFLSDDNDSTSLSNNWITSIVEDDSGNFWIGTDGGGLNYLNSTTYEFKRFRHDDSEPNSLAGDVVFRLLKDRNGDIWVGTNNGLSVVNQDDFTFQSWNDYEVCTECTNSVTSLAEDRNGDLWIGDEVNGLYYFNTKTQQFSLPFESSDKTLYTFFINDLLIQEQYLYIGASDGVKILNIDTQQLESTQSVMNSTHDILSGFIARYYKGRNGEILICSEGSGLALYNTKDNKLEVYDTEKGLSSNSVTDVIIDFSDNLWVVTRGGGANKFNLNKRMFKHWEHESDDSNSLVQNEVRAVLYDNNDVVWVGTNGGLSQYNLETQLFNNYVEDFDFKADASAPKIRLIYKDQTENLWISTQNGGFYKYLRDEDRFTSDEVYLSFEMTKGVKKVASIHEINADIMWLCTDGSGILEYNKKDKEIKKIKAKNDTLDILDNAIINVALKKNDEEVWLGTDRGLVLFDLETYNIRHWSRQKGDNSSLVGNKIRSMFIQNDTSIWIGTRSGLSQFNIKTNNFKQFKMKDGLPSDIIFGIMKGMDEDLWLSTPKGLSRLNSKTMDFKNIVIPQNNALDMGAHDEGPNGSLIVGGTAGLSVFYPRDHRNNSYIPNMAFVGFQIDNRVVQYDKEITQLDSLDLTYDQNNLTFTFSALEYSDPKKNKYQYYLEGFNEEWIDHGNRQEVSFTNLDPGSYILHIRGSNDDGVWNEEGTSIFIRIRYPWWATWWFKIIIVLIAITALGMLVKLRLRKVAKDKELLNQKIDEATNKVISQNTKLTKQKENLMSAIDEVNQVVKDAVESGNFNARIDLENKTGIWKEFGYSINDMFESVTRPFNEINRIVNRMAEGDLTLRYNEESNGEVKTLADNLNKALDILVDLLLDIANEVDSINLYSDEMLGRSENMNKSTREIAKAIAGMNIGAKRQVVKVSESSKIISVVQSFSDNMKEQAESINSSTSEGVEKSRSGMEQVKGLDMTMKDILSRSLKTNESINTLKDRSQEINSVLNIIKDVASQTNLLALNAAIEAAQAGEAGRGFAVVAEEIRKLAEDSKKSAGDIENLVMGVQHDTAITADLIDEMGDSIEKGGQATQFSLEAFTEITQGYEDTLHKSEQIMKATNQQTSDLTNAVNVISDIVLIAEETASSTQNTESSSSQLSLGMQEYTDKSKNVSNVSKELKEKVGKFKLK